jgi:DNA-binding SARP family transcriptional activator
VTATAPQADYVRSSALSFVIDGAKHDAPQLRLRLLGGFEAERAGGEWSAPCWHRRTAKTLTKLLAATPGHRLHRDQVLEILWPDVDPASALNSFGKALHAARRALEPELLPRESSSYLRLTDSLVALDSAHVWVDVDHFEHVAERALREGSLDATESALAAYGGELLPEDRYEDWCAERREYVAELHLRLLLSLAEALTSRGAHAAAATRLREALQCDPAREDVHRRLREIYAAAGTREQAVRQFHICRDVLRRELDMTPGDATESLYRELIAVRPAADEQGAFVGREAQLDELGGRLARADSGEGTIVLLGGETGVGKSRLVAAFAATAEQRGACVLWGSGAHANRLAYGPFAVALESFVAGRSAAERDELARSYPALVRFVPSLGTRNGSQSFAEDAGGGEIFLVPEIVRLLTDLAGDRSVVLVLGDLAGVHASTLNLLAYLAPLAARRRWLILGTYRDEALAPTSDLRRMIDGVEREDLCLRMELMRLTREDCDRLVRALLPGAGVAGAILDYVHQWSLGNPLFAEELVHEMLDRGELAVTNGEWRQELPPSPCAPARVRSLVGLRMAPMGEGVRRALELVAAASERQISLAGLRAGGAALKPPLSDAELFDALDRALELRILEEREGCYAFRHPIVGAAVYDELSKHRRDELQIALAGSRVDRA